MSANDLLQEGQRLAVTVSAHYGAMGRSLVAARDLPPGCADVFDSHALAWARATPGCPFWLDIEALPEKNKAFKSIWIYAALKLTGPWAHPTAQAAGKPSGEAGDDDDDDDDWEVVMPGLQPRQQRQLAALAGFQVVEMDQDMGDLAAALGLRRPAGVPSTGVLGDADLLDSLEVASDSHDEKEEGEEGGGVAPGAEGATAPSDDRVTQALHKAIFGMQLQAAFQVLFLNAFEAPGMTDLELEPSPQEAGGRPEGGYPLALFFLPSFVQHSCLPNCYFQFSEDPPRISVIPQRPINEGDPLSISYLGNGGFLELPGRERRKMLLDAKGFECQCARCTSHDEGIVWSCRCCGNVVLMLRPRPADPRLLPKYTLAVLIAIISYVTHISLCVLTLGRSIQT